MLKTKKGFLFRKLGDEYVVVPIGAASRTFNGMIRLNATGAFFWEELAAGTTKDALVQKMLARYEGLDELTARRDLQEFLDKIAVAIEEV